VLSLELLLQVENLLFKFDLLMVRFFFKGGSTVIEKFLLPPEKYIGMKLVFITEI